LSKPYNQFHKDSRVKSGLKSYCKACGNLYSQKQKQSGYWSTPERKLKSKQLLILRQYNLTWPEYVQMLKWQDYKCWICKSDFDINAARGEGSVNVDHCHKTGFVRALLCHKCNTGLGNFKDDPVLLQRAIEYLEIMQPKPDPRKDM
jgi:Recombination endonuclease VII